MISAQDYLRANAIKHMCMCLQHHYSRILLINVQQYECPYSNYGLLQSDKHKEYINSCGYYAV